tara:strand:+ start:2146 stop:2319 length:174 start_codon:yes stop_codon:yes gene_type:complete
MTKEKTISFQEHYILIDYYKNKIKDLQNQNFNLKMIIENEKAKLEVEKMNSNNYNQI